MRKIQLLVLLLGLLTLPLSALETENAVTELDISELQEEEVNSYKISV